MQDTLVNKNYSHYLGGIINEKTINTYCHSLSGALVLTACSKTQSNSSEQNNSSSSSSSSSSSTEEKKTRQAFDFSSMDKDGNTVKLSDYKGKKVYINVWASWCGPCVREMPELEKAYQKLKDKEDVVFLSITSPSDDVFKNQSPQDKDKATILAKAKELGVTYPVLFDVNDRFLINYTVRSFPTHVFINSDGTIANKVSGAVTESALEEEISKLK